MKLAILYATRYGATREVAERIAAGVRDRGGALQDVQLVEVTRGTEPLPEADVCLVGSPIYAGTIPRHLARYVDAHLDALVERRVGLFLSCLYEGSKAEQQLADNFPARLVAHSYGRYYVGGRIDFAGLRVLDRFIMKRVGGVSTDVQKISDAEIARIVAEAVEA